MPCVCDLFCIIIFIFITANLIETGTLQFLDIFVKSSASKCCLFCFCCFCLFFCQCQSGDANKSASYKKSVYTLL